MGSAKDSIVTAEELRSHNSPSDLWISIQGKVYDVTGWSKEHPGGDLPLLHLAGQDVTDAFVAYHPASAWAHLDRFLVGHFADYRVSPASKDYRRLLAEFTKAGLFDRKGHGTCISLAAMLLLLLSSVLRRVHGPPLDPVRLDRTQLGPLHRHEQLLPQPPRPDRVRELPHRDQLRLVEAEPQRPPHSLQQRRVRPGHARLPELLLLAHLLVLRPDHVLRYALQVPRQHPALDLLPAHVPRQAQPLRAVALDAALPPQPGASPPPGDPRHRRVLDLVPAAGLLPPDLARAGRVRAGQLLGHRRPARAVLPQPHLLRRLRRPAQGERLVREADRGDAQHRLPPLDGLVPGGLQFQVEHHLFPRLPMCHLRTVAPLVRELCRKHGLPYATAGFLEANWRTVKVLRNAALQARDLSSPVPKNLVWEAVNARIT